jgi:hypothetical protein
MLFIVKHAREGSQSFHYASEMIRVGSRRFTHDGTLDFAYLIELSLAEEQFRRCGPADLSRQIIGELGRDQDAKSECSSFSYQGLKEGRFHETPSLVQN